MMKAIMILFFALETYAEPLTALFMIRPDRPEAGQMLHQRSRSLLTEWISIDDVDLLGTSRRLCFVGDAKELCKMSKVWNQRALTEYEKGLHALTQIQRCEVDDDKLRMVWEWIHDWARDKLHREIHVPQCVLTADFNELNVKNQR
jgi:hypothetical protein